MNFTEDMIPSSMTSDECNDIINNQSEDPYMKVSLAFNFILIVVGFISELMGASKCSDSNGIIDAIATGLKKTIKKKNSRSREDDVEV